MKRGLAAFLLGIVVAWVGLPKGLHRAYWLGMGGALATGYVYGRGFGSISFAVNQFVGSVAVVVIGVVAVIMLIAYLSSL